MELAITIQTSSVIFEVFALPLCEREAYGTVMYTLTRPKLYQQCQQYRQQNYANSRQTQVFENFHNTDNCGKVKYHFCITISQNCMPKVQATSDTSKYATA